MKYALGNGVLIVHESFHRSHAHRAIVELVVVHFVVRMEMHILLLVRGCVAVVLCAPNSVTRFLHVDLWQIPILMSSHGKHCDVTRVWSVGLNSRDAVRLKSNKVATSVGGRVCCCPVRLILGTEYPSYLDVVYGPLYLDSGVFDASRGERLGRNRPRAQSR